MNDKKHPAIAKLQSTYGHVSKRLCKGFNAAISPPPPSQVIWKPKNPSIEWPTMVKGETLTREEWLDTGFPLQPSPRHRGRCIKYGGVETKNSRTFVHTSGRPWLSQAHE